MASIALKEADTYRSEPRQRGPEFDRQDWVTLRRSGQQPIRFKGTAIAEATGHSPEGTLWYEINIFRKQTGGFVLDLRVFRKGRGQKDSFHAYDFDSLGEAVSFLENHDPQSDIPVHVDTDDKSISTAELTLKAVALRQRLEEAERDYRSLVGDLLYQLDIVDTSV